MRLLFLADSASPHTRRWVNWFASNSHEVHLVSFNSKSEHGFSNVKIHYVWDREIPISALKRWRRSILIMLRLRKLVKKLKPDVIHSHSLGAYSWSIMFLRFKPRVITPWGTDLLIDFEQSKINAFLSRKSLRSAELVTTDAFYFSEILLNLGVKQERIKRIPFGTDCSLFQPSSKSLRNEVIRIVSTRTLNPVHQVNDLISAIPMVLKKRNDVHFVIVGGGSELNLFKNQIQSLGLEEKVSFTGMLTEIELVQVLRESDIYVSTSPYDAGLAASTAEAMACGLPVIHTNTGDNFNWISESGGYLYTPGNVEDLTNSILALLEIPQKWLRMGEVNRIKIIENNNLSVCMIAMESEYLRLMRNS